MAKAAIVDMAVETRALTGRVKLRLMLLRPHMKSSRQLLDCPLFSLSSISSNHNLFYPSLTIMEDQLTHEALIKPIPCKISLANAQDREPSKPCQFCALIIPDRRKAQVGLIHTGYERIDLYPDFPELKASARAGCDFCRLIRKTIRKNWAIRPMEEWGFGPITESDGLWDELLDAPWDRKVKIHKARFSLQDIVQTSTTSPTSSGITIMEEGMIVTLGLDFGPATLFVSPETNFQYGEIGQVINFDVFDSQGEPQIK
jgi:hypothetical protein